MWSRELFKSNAKLILKRGYWTPFFLCLIVAILTGGLSAVNGFSGNSSGNSSLSDVSSVNPWLLVSIMGAVASVGFLIGIVYAFFISAPVTVGQSKFFLDNRKGISEMGSIFYAFKAGHYINVVKGMVWRSLFVFLWSLLFLIPGIIKAYSYYLVHYILADNPDMQCDRALKLSMAMTKGYKWNIFVLQLSFIGWYLLGLVCLGVGVLFVTPYNQATQAEMYVFLRTRAIEQGICTREDLNLALGE